MASDPEQYTRHKSSFGQLLDATRRQKLASLSFLMNMQLNLEMSLKTRLPSKGNSLTECIAARELKPDPSTKTAYYFRQFLNLRSRPADKTQIRSAIEDCFVSFFHLFGNRYFNKLDGPDFDLIKDMMVTLAVNSSKVKINECFQKASSERACMHIWCGEAKGDLYVLQSTFQTYMEDALLKVDLGQQIKDTDRKQFIVEFLKVFTFETNFPSRTEIEEIVYRKIVDLIPQHRRCLFNATDINYIMSVLVQCITECVTVTREADMNEATRSAHASIGEEHNTVHLTNGKINELFKAILDNLIEHIGRNVTLTDVQQLVNERFLTTKGPLETMRQHGGLSGQIWEQQFILLAFICFSSESKFSLAYQMEDADKFDDLIVKNSEGKCLLRQSKHLDPSTYGDIEATQLFATDTRNLRSDKDKILFRQFSLAKYFESFVTILNKSTNAFTTGKLSIKELSIVTSLAFAQDLVTNGYVEKTSDETNFAWGNNFFLGERYQFNCATLERKHPDFIQKLVQVVTDSGRQEAPPDVIKTFFNILTFEIKHPDVDQLEGKLKSKLAQLSLEIESFELTARETTLFYDDLLTRCHSMVEVVSENSNIAQWKELHHFKAQVKEAVGNLKNNRSRTI